MKYLGQAPVVIVIIIGSCFGSFALNLFSGQYSPGRSFCSPKHIIYQAMVEGDWKKNAVSYPSPPFLEPKNSSSKLYYTEAYKETGVAKPALIFANTDTGGSGPSTEGFFYLLPNQSIPRFWYERYWITYLDQDIYCYRVRDF